LAILADFFKKSSILGMYAIVFTFWKKIVKAISR